MSQYRRAIEACNASLKIPDQPVWQVEETRNDGGASKHQRTVAHRLNHARIGGLHLFGNRSRYAHAGKHGQISCRSGQTCPSEGNGKTGKRAERRRSQVKEERKWRDEMDAAFGKTPDMFHRRVEQTLRSLQAEQREEPVVKRKVNGDCASCGASDDLCNRRGGQFTGILDDITRTAAQHWVLDDAGAMVRTNGGEHPDRVIPSECEGMGLRRSAVIRNPERYRPCSGNRLLRSERRGGLSRRA